MTKEASVKKTKYRTIRVPEELVLTIKRIINHEAKPLGYRSHSEMIIDAARRRIEKFMNKEVSPLKLKIK
ncbi:MAG: hypothetical protein GF353_24745 [Candidatus Lokiarchaeota archaeon]|nr:hypothetical protein [Candidatus Lokiarchaeota archaeon]